ncbi:MAG TPA: hypothetical protein VGS58_04635 [Candidatus Sulfopaludibacter sp.]|nr:hypothetical protein [Candidatus Sulfopaludibacter sp.]
MVAPPSVTVKSDGFTPAGTEQGFNLYTRDAIPAGLPFDVSVSGTAPPPQASQNDQQGNDQDPAVNSRANETIQALPNRLDSLRWIIIGGFAALIAIGLLFLWRQPVLGTAAGAGDMPVPQTPSQGPRKRKAPPVTAARASAIPSAPAKAVASTPPQAASGRSAVPLASATAVAEPANVASPASSVETEVQSGLDALKDKLFRLELRRQAGTISEEDYARERALTEQILRELVRG